MPPLLMWTLRPEGRLIDPIENSRAADAQHACDPTQVEYGHIALAALHRTNERAVQVACFGELGLSQTALGAKFADDRQQLAERRWPKKTNILSEFRYRLHFKRTGLGNSLVDAVSATDLSLVDFPGERLADMSMAGRSFAEWSDALLDLMKRKYSHLQESRDYRFRRIGDPTELAALRHRASRQH